MFSVLKKIGRWFGAGRALGVAMLAFFVAMQVWNPLPLHAVRLKIFDFYQQLQPREQKGYPVVIVDIDDKSLAEEGQWPWPRTRVSDMILEVTRLGGVAVAFDILFSEPDGTSPAEFARRVGSIDAETKKRLMKLPSNDGVLALAFKRKAVVLAQSGYHEESVWKGTKKPPTTGIATIGQDPTSRLLSYKGILRNVPILEYNAAGRGMVSVLPDWDGVVRRVPLLQYADGKIVPSITMEMLRLLTGSSAVGVRANAAGVSQVFVKGLKVQTDANAHLWVHFNKHDRKRYVSAVDLLNKRVPEARIKNKIVMVGTSATALFDIKSTPLNPVLPGVEIHPQVLESLLTKTQLKRPNFAHISELALSIGVSLAIIAAAPVFGALTVLVMGGVMAAGVAGTSWWYFSTQGLLLDAFYPLATALIIFSAMVFFNYIREESQKRQIRGAFGQYLSPDLVDQLADDPEKLTLGGETRELTILFSDVRGFTSISETYKSDPQGLTKLINRLLTPLSHVILDNNGTIDKYMGDNVMAFWNAPLDDDDHAEHACLSSLQMLTALEKLNAERLIEDKEAGRESLPLHVGVGINTGECVVGNVGSDMRFDYSVLGDTVNLAARLEGQTKSYGVDTIIGQITAGRVKGKFALLELDAIRVKGKTEPEVIFSIIGTEEMLRDADFLAHEENHVQLLAAYRAMKWPQARKIIKACRQSGEKFNLSGLYDLYEERISAFKTSPPPKDWDGVFTMETK
ncbi:MAG: adenylate/guanylate cyclase domain-containing protein [Rhizobiales bacterium]|nr:adenylate/guanylate cyclase domain-containing protein [Hyphomicrobiales bacterium]